MKFAKPCYLVYQCACTIRLLCLQSRFNYHYGYHCDAIKICIHFIYLFYFCVLFFCCPLAFLWFYISLPPLPLLSLPPSLPSLPLPFLSSALPPTLPSCFCIIPNPLISSSHIHPHVICALHTAHMEAIVFSHSIEENGKRFHVIHMQFSHNHQFGQPSKSLNYIYTTWSRL